ncbi:MAG: T9SS type B sorting domain-containing protein [Flavobacteriales bacterium]|nr:T9SS type B sorting domain-containing protein [Flavobacteriales bacterium]
MKKLIVLFFIYSSCFSQRESNIWYFGNNAGIDFNSVTAIDLNDGLINTNEGCATICNSAGQLLFYTDGGKAWTRDHIVMPNGDNLLGHSSSTQSAIIVPKPNSNNIFYIFTTTAQGGNSGMRYSEVDMNLNGGFGDVTNNKNILLHTPVCEKICAIKNSEGDGYWVMTHAFGDNSFLAFNVDSNGVNLYPIATSIGTTIANENASDAYRTQGQLKFSPDGTMLVCVNRYNDVQLFNFDASTGIVSNEITLNTADYMLCYGAEFSQSSKTLYLSAGYTSYSLSTIIQYDLTSADIPNSEILITDEYPFYFGSLQLATDGKIYCAGTYTNGNHNYLSVINSPENIGADCQFNFNQIPLSGICRLGLPQSIQSNFDANIVYENNCGSNDVTFSVNSNLPISSITWDFGDGSNVATVLNPTHSYNSVGNYLVSATFSTTNGTFTRTKIVNLVNPPIANSIPPIILCDQIGSQIDLSEYKNSIAGSQSLDLYRISYFASMTDAINHLNVLPEIQVLTSSESTFYAKIYYYNNFNCYSLSTIEVTFSEKPIVIPSIDLKGCDSFPYDNSEAFDFTSLSSLIILNDDQSSFSATYHLTLSEAQNNSNPLPQIYYTSNIEETLYARVENTINTNCYAITTIEIKVAKQPFTMPISNYILCEENSGSTIFDLTSKNSEILAGQSIGDFNIDYYLSYNDAENDMNILNSNYTNTSNPQTIYIRISNNANRNCFIITTMILEVKQKPEFELNQTYSICEGNNTLQISLPTNFASYIWSTGATTSSVVITEPGDYSVTVSHDNENILCQTTKSFSVEMSNVATIQNIETEDLSDNNNFIIIHSFGLGDYEYSIDGITYQDSNVFEYLDAGEYTIFVRDKNGCGTTLHETYILTYPKYFTPNNDGYNDYWKVKYSQLETNIKIMIFDRFGKLLKVLNNDLNVWDGKLDGQDLPSDDYWFVIQRANGKEYKGNFTLKR